MKHTKNILLLALLGTVVTLGVKHYTTDAPAPAQGDLLTAEQADAQLRAKGISPADYTSKLLEAAANGDAELLRLLTAAQPGRIVRAEQDNTALHLAAQNGHAAVCDILATQHHITNETNAAGQTALHMAAKEGHTDCVDILLSRGAEPNKSDTHEYSPLLYAAEGGHAGCVELLLGAGASLQARTGDGKTVSEIASKYPEVQQILSRHLSNTRPSRPAAQAPQEQRTMLPTDVLYTDEQITAAIKQGNTGQLNNMFDTGLSPDYRMEGKLPLIIKATQQQKADIVKLLLEKGATPNARASNGDMALHTAAALGNDEILTLLSAHRTDLHSQVNGTDALIKAIHGKHLSTVRLLITEGADVNATSANGETPLIAAASAGQADIAAILIEAGATVNTGVDGKTAMNAAVLNGHADCLQLLINHGASPKDIPVNKRTALHIAAEANATDCIAILIRAGAEPNTKDANNETPLHIAAKLGHLGTIEQLIRNGADLHTRDGNNQTALHLVAACGHAHCISALCTAGAEIEGPTADGYTPLHLAAKAGQITCIQNLLKEGANVSAKSYHEETPLQLAEANGQRDCAASIALFILNSQGIEEISEGTLLAAIEQGDQTKVAHLLHAGCRVSDQSIIAAAGKGNEAILYQLLGAGGKVKPEESAGTTPLHAAAAAGKISCLKILIKHHAPIEAKDAADKTAAQLAAAHGHKECAALLRDAELLFERDITSRSYGKALVEAAAKGDHLTARRLINLGVDIEYRDNEGNTAMHKAASAKSMTCTKILLEAGAKADVLNNEKESPLMVAARLGRSSNVRALLAGGANADFEGGEDIAATVAIKHGQIECLQHLLDGERNVNGIDGKKRPIIYTAVAKENIEALHILLERGADPNIDINGTPLLFIAIKCNSDEVLQKLMESGKVNLGVTNEQGEYATHIAAQSGNISAMALFFRAGIPHDLKDKEGQVILHHAARYNRTKLIEQLLKLGMNPAPLDNRGRTPFDIAQQAGHEKCSTLLQGDIDIK